MTDGAEGYELEDVGNSVIHEQQSDPEWPAVYVRNPIIKCGSCMTVLPRRGNMHSHRLGDGRQRITDVEGNVLHECQEEADPKHPHYRKVEADD